MAQPLAAEEEQENNEEQEKVVGPVRGQEGDAVPAEPATEEEQLVQQIQEKAQELLDSWAGLQEVFRIPKKQRQEERIKHERAADLGWPPQEERVKLQVRRCS